MPKIPYWHLTIFPGFLHTFKNRMVSCIYSYILYFKKQTEQFFNCQTCFHVTIVSDCRASVSMKARLHFTRVSQSKARMSTLKRHLERKKTFLDDLTIVHWNWVIQSQGSGPGEMVLQLGALAVLANGLIWFPAPTWCLTTVWNASPGRPKSFFCAHACDTHTYVWAKYSHT